MKPPPQLRIRLNRHSERTPHILSRIPQNTPHARDLADLAAKGLLPVKGAGKATRYAIAMDQ